MFNPSNQWDIHVAGEGKFKYNKSDMPVKSNTFSLDLTFSATLKKDGNEIVLENLYQYKVFYEHGYNRLSKGDFYRGCIEMMQNKGDILNKEIRKMIIEAIKRHFKMNKLKSDEELFNELIKENIQIKMDLKVEDRLIQ